MGAQRNVWLEVLACLMQVSAALGWCLVWIVGPYTLAGTANMSGDSSWEFFVTAFNFTIVVFGWPLAAILAWISYSRAGKSTAKMLLMFSSLPYLHVAIIAAGLCVLYLTELVK